MERVRDGDVAPLGVLFERYQGPLYNFFVRLTGRAATSEDLVQEVFLRILKYRHTYRGHSAFRTWMYQIARNTRVDHYRKHWRESELGDDGGVDLPSAAASASDTLADAQDAALVREALARLPVDKREVLVLSRFHDMRYEEIGRVMGCSEGTIKVRVHRAMKELREVYRQMTRDEAERT
jgi:RNA polymerase sigma-70 factor (ECF subfamily)